MPAHGERGGASEKKDGVNDTTRALRDGFWARAAGHREVASREPSPEDATILRHHRRPRLVSTPGSQRQREEYTLGWRYRAQCETQIVRKTLIGLANLALMRGEIEGVMHSRLLPHRLSSRA